MALASRAFGAAGLPGAFGAAGLPGRWRDSNSDVAHTQKLVQPSKDSSRTLGNIFSGVGRRWGEGEGEGEGRWRIELCFFA